MTNGSRELIVKNWVQHTSGSNQNSVGTNAVSFPASNVAGIGDLAANLGNRTRFVALYNTHATATIYLKPGTTAAAPTADENSWPVPPGSRAILQMPQGGQGIVSCIASGAGATFTLHWGIGAG